MADSGILTLTPAETSQSKLVLYTAPVEATQGLSISFDFYSYGGSGGDGAGFFFVNGSTIPGKPGGFGGSLGYAPLLNSGISGLNGGYLGIGLDEYGNYTSPLDERPDGPGFRPDSISVRGSEAAGYRYLGGSQTLPISLDNPGAGATRENSKRTAKIDLSPTGDLTIAIDLNGDGDTVDLGEQVVNFNVIAAGNEALPTTFRFGFAASTGALTNTHEVGNFDVRTFNGVPIAGNFTDSLIIYGDNGVSTGGTGGTGTGGTGTDGTGTGSDPTSSGGSIPGDVITGTAGADIIVGTSGQDVITGNGKGDRFVFSGVNKRSALRSSTVKNLDQITDFNQPEGDRVQLDFDNNLSTVELPKKLFNAGKFKGKLENVAKQAYADKNFKRKGNQALRADEAVFFKIGKRTYLSVNDNRRSFSATNDLLVNVSGIDFNPGDLNRGNLAVTNYFV